MAEQREKFGEKNWDPKEDLDSMILKNLLQVTTTIKQIKKKTERERESEIYCQGTII